MSRTSTRLPAIIVVFTVALAGAASAQTDPTKCHKEVVKNLAKYKKTYLKAVSKCLDGKNEGKLPPNTSCPDAAANLKISKVALQAPQKVAAKCSLSDLTTTLGFRNDCQYETATTGVEGATCSPMTVASAADVASCLLCWKGAELAEFIAILYASHASEVCGGALDETSPVCSDLDCATPLPDQRNLSGTSSGGEEFCQRGIAKAGIKYLLTREKDLEQCALKGGTSADCLSASLNPTVALKLQKAQLKKDGAIKTACGNRDPAPAAPFCCRTGMGNSCSVATSRDDCTMNLGGTVQEGKTCNAGNCNPVTGGNKTITWWNVCPESDCTGTLTKLQDLIDCVDSTVDDAIVPELLCLQFRGNGGSDWPCPAADGP